MRVNVFISDVDDSAGKPPRLLVLPLAPDAAIPKDFRSEEWTYFATTDTSDKLLGAPARDIEEKITDRGYALVDPTG